MFVTGHFARSFGAIGLAFLSAIMISLWWTFRGARGKKLKRFGIVIVGIGLFVAAWNFLLRREGSVDGTALPRYTWRWSASATPRMAALSTKTTESTDLGAAPAGLEDWTRFMGPNGDGMLPPPKWKTDWKAHPPREVWRQPIGLGWSGYAVLGRRAITQEQRDEEECVTCYDVVTGKLLWSHADKALFSERMGGDGPRGTPTIHAGNKLVYTLGATGILNCLEVETGKLRWTRNVLEDAGAENIEWGKSVAPLLHRDRVIVSGGKKGATLLAYQQSDGKPLWKAGTDAATYSTPSVHTLGGREQFVSVNQESVTGHSVDDGKILWTFEWPGTFPKVAQAIPAGPDRILVTSSYGVKSHLLEVKASPDGAFACTSVWSSSAPRTKFSSVTVHEGQVYGLDEGMLASVDLATGERGWREGRYGFGQHLQLGDIILVQTERGPVVVVRVNKGKPEELGRVNALSSMTWNPPTLAGRWLLVRNDREAVCYELQP
jgi:outer membrane protein assembly factor BamB